MGTGWARSGWSDPHGRHARSDDRPMARARPRPRDRPRRLRPMALPLRMRSRAPGRRLRTQTRTLTELLILLAADTWRIEGTALRDLAEHAGTLQQPARQAIRRLWRTWHPGTPGMGRAHGLAALPRSRGSQTRWAARIPRPPFARSHQRRRRLPAWQRPMGHAARASKAPPATEATPTRETGRMKPTPQIMPSAENANPGRWPTRRAGFGSGDRRRLTRAKEPAGLPPYRESITATIEQSLNERIDEIMRSHRVARDRERAR